MERVTVMKRTTKGERGRGDIRARERQDMRGREGGETGTECSVVAHLHKYSKNAPVLHYHLSVLNHPDH